MYPHPRSVGPHLGHRITAKRLCHADVSRDARARSKLSAEQKPPEYPEGTRPRGRPLRRTHEESPGAGGDAPSKIATRLSPKPATRWRPDCVAGLDTVAKDSFLHPRRGRGGPHSSRRPAGLYAARRSRRSVRVAGPPAIVVLPPKSPNRRARWITAWSTQPVAVRSARDVSEVNTVRLAAGHRPRSQATAATAAGIALIG